MKLMCGAAFEEHSHAAWWVYLHCGGTAVFHGGARAPLAAGNPCGSLKVLKNRNKNRWQCFVLDCEVTAGDLCFHYYDASSCVFADVC